MSLRELQNELEDLTGVSRTTMLENGTLKVVWQAEPHDYSRELRQLRNDHQEVEHIRTPANEPDATPDGMPIHYYSE